MESMSVLISGAGIGGPALAYWLDRYGFCVTVVEKAPELRPGGQAVDFKGATHRTVLSRMGILDDVRRLQTGGQDGTVVDAAGRKLAVIPGEFSGGEIEIVRLLAPRTRLGMRVRNALFSVSFLFKPLMKLTDRFATDIELADY